MNDHIQKLCNFAQQYYCVPHRHYHNWEHALFVVDNVELIGGEDCANADAIKLAAFWHDAVYIPGAKDCANEICSAQLLSNAAREFPKVDQQVVNLAVRMIECTTIQHHLCHATPPPELAILLDADIYGLTTPSFQHFLDNQRNIIFENGGQDIPEHHTKCAIFLQNFLTCREQIYHTEYMRKNREHQARKNIETYVKMFV